MAILFTVLKIELNMRKSIKNFWVNINSINKQVFIDYLIKVYSTRGYLYIWDVDLGDVEIGNFGRGLRV